MSAATPVPAATIVVLRESPLATLEVLLVRRNDKVAFMAGAVVFPGGRVDDADRAEAARRGSAARAERPFPDLTPDEELQYRVAATRELQEEAGVRVRVDDLVALAHWVTPEIEIRRYDTRFFIVRMPEGQDAQHDAAETTELTWLTPEAALGRCERDEIMLPPPTWTTLKQLAKRATVDDAIAWAGRTPIVRIQPGFIRDEQRTMLTLPGDPLHPAVPGWEIPEDTRFVLTDGKRWKPVAP